jgi:hypothetical protein
MLKFYGIQPPNHYANLRPGGICPYCKESCRFTRTSNPDVQKIMSDEIKYFILSYSCDACLMPIPIKWYVQNYSGGDQIVVQYPQELLISKEPFNFDHVPDLVKQEIQEAIDCLSVNAYNGFAALCRRSIQAICTNLGAGASDKVKSQVNEMITATGLDEEWRELTIQIMLSGHDGAHPHLPEVGLDRSTVLLSLVQDLTYQLYTRPGKIKEAASLRQIAINRPRDQQ